MKNRGAMAESVRKVQQKVAKPQDSTQQKITEQDASSPLDRLGGRQREIYRQRLYRALQLMKKRGNIPHRSATRPLPLTFSQIMFWVAELRAPGIGVYDIPDLLELVGHLDVRALKGALDALTRRHEILRTAVIVVGEQPCQIVQEKVPARLPLVDLSGLGEADRAQQAIQQVDRFARRPIVLDTAPLWHVLVLRLEERRHRLLLNFHHLVSDGWSLGVFHRELTELYNAEYEARAHTLPEVAAQYGDYTLWLYERVKQRDFDEDLEYWFEHLAGGLPWLRLPTDRPRPKPLKHRGGFRFTTLPERFKQAVAARGHDVQSSTFVVLLSALMALMARYSGGEQVMVGTPVANREQRQLEEMLGCCINLLLLRTHLSGNPTVDAWIRRVRDAAIGGFSHQELSFVQLKMEYAKEVPVPLDRPPFQVLFTYLNTPHSFASTFKDLAVSRPYTVDRKLADRELTLGITEHGQGMAVSLHYLADLFDAVTIDRMLRHWRCMLEQILEFPERRLHDLRILPDSEYQQILVEWGLHEPKMVAEEVDGEVDAFWRVIDAAGRPVPINIVGELVGFRGEGLAPLRSGLSVCQRADGRFERVADPLADAPILDAAP